MISIIVPYHLEGREFILETIACIESTIDVDTYEIIVVDDGSDLQKSWLPGHVRMLKHIHNQGVGAAFDTGVSVAQYDNLFLMGDDIRFLPNKWASQIIKEIEDHPKAFTCTSCVNLNRERPENMDIEKRRLISVVNGATIILFHDKLSNPRKPESFRGIIEAQWLPVLKDRNVDSYEIPCILGAAYGVSKAWYNEVDGWAGHRLWGTLEPHIALKSYLFGGSCRTAPRIETGHIFKRVGNHNTPQDILMYNKMMVATLLFDDYNRLIHFLGTNSIVERARLMYQAKLPWILEKKFEYKDKTVLSIEEYVSRWGIDYRK
jgi:glycosyltransferase involved in cell wall biosynthesis